MKNDYYLKATFNLSRDSVGLQVTSDKSMPSFLFRIQQVGNYKTKPPYFTDRGGMESFLIIFTLSGKGKLCYDEEVYDIGAGDCFFINCIHPHRYETVGDDGWDFLYVHFTGGNARGYYNEFVRNGFQTVHFEDTSVLETSIRRILDVNLKRDRNTNLISSNLIGSILTELLIGVNAGDRPAVFTPDYIRSVAKEIDEQYQQELTLDYFARQHSVNKFHLSKEFKRCIGTTVHEYLINARISRAKELLIYSDMPVADIAAEVGVDNVSHFINLFKARENQTPLSFRKQWRTR